MKKTEVCITCHQRGALLKSIKSGLLALVLASGLSSSAQTITTSTNFDLSPGIAVPDDNTSGLASAKTISTPISYITKVKVNLKLSGTFNGDIYCYLAHRGTNAILLNRVGRCATSNLGYSDKGFDLVFDDASTNGDVHVYCTKKGLLSGPLTNSWVADGRRTNPTDVATTDPRISLLNVFNGTNPNGEWVLFVADMEAGGFYTLNDWGLEITGYTPPSIVSAPVNASTECSSGSATFTVNAAGTAPLNYQWRFNSTPISGATGTSLTLNSVTFANVGSYDVAITNNYGSITSAAATLTVRDTTAPVPDLASLPPVIAQRSASLPPAPTATDACEGQIVGVPDKLGPFGQGHTTITWTFTDSYGNHASQTQAVHVQDTQNPTITAPAALADVPTVLSNQAPIVEDISIGAVENHSRSLLIDKVDAHCYEPDNDPMFLSVSSTSTNRGTVALTPTAIVYTPVTNFVGEDRFTYTVDDGRGGVSSATIIVQVYPADALTPNITGLSMSGGVFHVRFAGIPGFTYHIERTGSLSPANWTEIGSVVAPEDGQVEFDDTNPPAGSGYYRTASPLP